MFRVVKTGLARFKFNEHFRSLNEILFRFQTLQTTRLASLQLWLFGYSYFSRSRVEPSNNQKRKGLQGTREGRQHPNTDHHQLQTKNKRDNIRRIHVAIVLSLHNSSRHAINAIGRQRNHLPPIQIRANSLQYHFIHHNNHWEHNISIINYHLPRPRGM